MSDEKKLEKCFEIMAKEISHCPKGYDCLYDKWMVIKRNCAKCWENYINRLVEKEK